MTVCGRLAALAAAAVVTGACTGEIMTSNLYRANSDSFFRYGASRGEMLAVVVGNPFPVPKAILDRSVTESMQRNHHGPMTVFSTDPGPRADRNFRVVVAFDTPNAMHPRVLCGDPAAVPSRERDGKRIEADVAFCVESDLYSNVDISIPEAESPADPRFRHMIASAMWALIPSRDPLSDNNDECFGPGC